MLTTVWQLNYCHFVELISKTHQMLPSILHYRHLHRFNYKILTPEISLDYSVQFLVKKKKKNQSALGFIQQHFASCMGRTEQDEKTG
jgi:hypothetical protein